MVPYLRPLSILMFGVVLSLASTGCLRRGLIMTESADSTVGVTVVGDIETVAEGRAGDGAELAFVSPGVFEIATGYAAAGRDAEASQISQALVLDDTVFVRGVELGRLGELNASGDAALTPFMAGLSGGEMPTARYEIRGEVELLEVVREAAGRHGPAIFLVGFANFSVVEGVGLVRAPSGGGEVFGDRYGQYFQEGLVRIDAPVLFAGAILEGVDGLNGSTRRVFWVQPGRESLTDELGAVTAAILSTGEGVSPAWPESAAPHVREVLTLDMRSTIEDGELLVYKIDDFVSR